MLTVMVFTVISFKQTAASGAVANHSSFIVNTTVHTWVNNIIDLVNASLG